MILTTQDIIALRDGLPHTIGPLTLRFHHDGEGQATAELKIRSETAVFQLDWLDAEAIAFCIAPSADLWTARDSDKELQKETGETRGWLRLEVTSDRRKLGALTGWSDKPFQMARIITDASAGQAPIRWPKGPRTTDYRREAFRLVSRRQGKDTRISFVQCCHMLARASCPNLPENWPEEAAARLCSNESAVAFLGDLQEECDADV